MRIKKSYIEFTFKAKRVIQSAGYIWIIFSSERERDDFIIKFFLNNIYEKNVYEMNIYNNRISFIDNDYKITEE